MGCLRRAMEALGRGSLVEVRGVSRVYETEPVEVEEEQPDYLNCVIEVVCDVSVVELMRFCQGIEAALGRERKGEKAARTLDIDILLFGREVLERRDLVIPHPGVLRAFNLKGIADLAPEVYIPGRGAVGELLAGTGLSGMREFGEDL